MLQVMLFVLPTLAILSVLVYLERDDGGTVKPPEPSGRKTARKRPMARRP